MKKLNRIMFILPFMAVLFFWNSLLSQEIVTVDGVKTIINKGNGIWGNNPPVQLEPVMKLGLIDGLDENYLFYMPSDITVDNSGDIYVLDTGNYEIKKFSPAGKFILRFGKKGQGPGEFGFPTSVNINPAGNIVVTDRVNGRINIFSPSGRYLTCHSWRDKYVKTCLVNSDNNYVMGFGLKAEEWSSSGYLRAYENKSSPLLTVYDNNGIPLLQMGNIYYFSNKMKCMAVNTGYFCLDNNGNYYISFKKINRIDKYGPDGRNIFSLKRHLNYEVDEPGRGKVQTSGISRSVTLPRMNLVSKGIAVDEKDRIWVVTAGRQMREEEKTDLVIRYINNDPPLIDIEGDTELVKTDIFELEVFDKNGVLLGKFPLRHFVDGLKIFGNRVYIPDTFRGMQYFVYKIAG